jgi:WD40 repeat protein
VKMWDPRNGRKLLTLRGHSSAVCSVAFSSDHCCPRQSRTVVASAEIRRFIGRILAI